MIKFARVGVLCLICGAPSVRFAQAQPKTFPNALSKTTKPTPVSAQGYRSRLQNVLREVNALAPRPPRPLGKIVKKLDHSFAVRRADGQIQNVDGDFWSNFARELGAPKDVSRSEIRRAQSALQAQILALDEWQHAPSYRSADAGKIVADLESSGQIRVGPVWWQKALSDAWGSVVAVWDSFWTWLNGLFPKPKASTVKATPGDTNLWFLFYGVVAALVGVILWFLWRVFGGKLSGRRVKVASDLQGEDAELLQLAPEELLSRAAQFAAQGNFREALRHRYLSLLIDLDARGAWRYDGRRTNWEHIASLRRGTFNRELLTPLSTLTRRFDRVRYGGAPCDNEGWLRFDAEARDFESQASGQKIAVNQGARGAEVRR